jgi:hypothetical protein
MAVKSNPAGANGKNYFSTVEGRPGQKEWPFFFAAFFFCQCCFRAFVTFVSHARSWTGSSDSDAAKYFTLLCSGLPNGLSSRAATRIGTSDGWQFSTQVACSVVRRADNGRGRWPQKGIKIAW